MMESQNESFLVRYGRKIRKIPWKTKKKKGGGAVEGSGEEGKGIDIDKCPYGGRGGSI